MPLPQQPVIASPCHEDWASMPPAARGRACASCRTTVIDLTVMGPRQAARVLADAARARAADPRATCCVRAHADADGRLIASGSRRLLTNGMAAILAVAMAGCGGSGACTVPSAPHAAPHAPAATSQPVPAPVRVLTGEVQVQVPAPRPAPRVLMGDVCELPVAAPKPPDALLCERPIAAPKPPDAPVCKLPIAPPKPPDAQVLLGRIALPPAPPSPPPAPDAPAAPPR